VKIERNQLNLKDHDLSSHDSVSLRSLLVRSSLALSLADSTARDSVQILDILDSAV
jgi:hypothetical protein